MSNKPGIKSVLVLLLSVLALVGVVGWFFFWRVGSEQQAALSGRAVATQHLGKYIAERFPSKKVLILSNPFTKVGGRTREIYQFEQAGIDGLLDGLGDKIPHKVVYPELRPEALKDPKSVVVDPDTTTPLSFLVAENSLDKLARENPGFDIFVSLIGLPISLKQNAVWSEKRIQFALLLPDLRMVGNLEALREAFQSSRIIAAVLNKPGAPADDNAAPFEDRFLLVTPENLDSIVGNYPRLF